MFIVLVMSLPCGFLKQVSAVLAPGRFIVVPICAGIPESLTASAATQQALITRNDSNGNSSRGNAAVSVPVLDPINTQRFSAPVCAAIETVFTLLDTDCDGVLKAAELGGFLRATEAAHMPQDALKFILKTFDCRDGGLTLLGLQQVYRLVTSSALHE